MSRTETTFTVERDLSGHVRSRLLDWTKEREIWRECHISHS